MPGVPFIVINTCQKYYEATTPPLIDSLVKAGVPLDVVHVVVGETPEPACTSTTFMGAHVHFVRYANVDNNALLWAAFDAPFSDEHWIFYLHDTCTVEPYFWDKVCETLDGVTKINAVAAKLCHPSSMCIGWYSLHTLRAVAHLLRRFVNTDASPSVMLNIKKNVDFLEDVAFCLVQTVGNVYVCQNEYRVIERDVFVYNTATPRIVEFYENPGIRKYKASWDRHLLDIRL